MKMKRTPIAFISAVLCAIIAGSTLMMTLSSCKKKNQKVDALVLMSEEVDGLFNPFFATTGADMEIIGMTQLGMLTTELDEKNEPVLVYGNEYATIALDYEKKYDQNADKTYYTFVLKNGLKFSDGKPLTMNDVLFTMYVYLDLVYSGSSTMYSTDIVGLQEYRTQTAQSGTSTVDEQITKTARNSASARITELVNLYRNTNKVINPGSSGYSVTESQMKEAISKATPSTGYKNAVSNNPDEVTNAQLLEDYNYALKLFKEELEGDYKSAKEAFKDVPYSDFNGGKDFDEVTSFMLYEGYVTLEYEKKVVGGKETDDKSKIKKLTRNYNTDVVKDMASAIDYVYNAKVTTAFHEIIMYWGTANKLLTEYTSRATDLILHKNLKDGELSYKRIKGVESLGHNTEESAITVNGNNYKVAHDYNADGTVKNNDEYAVLRITINGVDPKAEWNFSFSVSPAHYYAEDYIKDHPIDIANDQFGVEWASFNYMKNVIQTSRNVKVPVGAGPYVATDRNGNDNPDGNEFHSNNVVYFKANPNFLLGEPKTKKVNYQVVSSTNALNVLENGDVHFVTPQFTRANADKIESLKKSGIASVSTKQLGYGYIGVSAAHIPNINHRKAIMSAMNTTLALSYYKAGTAENISWPMSIVNWAYPKNADGSLNNNNSHDYASYVNDAKALENIKKYTDLAGGAPGSKITFTVAGSSLSEHPTYLVFKNAAELLESCGWTIEVVPDTQALTKLSTGALSVWAAAWGSTIDPDMYQVYHKNSTATSVTAWGYNAIKSSSATYPTETKILGELSDIIDQAREIDDRAQRSALYKTAMSYVLDLAIELPVYQREVLYAYNENVIKTESLPDVVNPYSSPLGKIWEVEIYQ